ncbi:MAG: hypothetical protein GC185_08935 [Alphaproteobacteria bacterium]|nr:hypothetical protein [Alphaproteobacteria bacterium]
MGMKDWLDKFTKNAKDKEQESKDPEAIKKAKKEAAERTFRRTTKAIQIAKKGLSTYNDTSKKVGELTDEATKKAAELAEKAKPAAEKVDKAAGWVGKKAKGAFETAKGTVNKGVDAASKKIEEVREDNAKKPSTGSGLLDLLAPAVPETDATKPKKPAAPKQPQPKPPSK